jgi:hypothetical protein
MRGQSRTITRLSNENSELQGKLDLAQRKISKLLELAQLDVEDDIEDEDIEDEDIEDEGTSKTKTSKTSRHRKQDA